MFVFVGVHCDHFRDFNILLLVIVVTLLRCACAGTISIYGLSRSEKELVRPSTLPPYRLLLGCLPYADLGLVPRPYVDSGVFDPINRGSGGISVSWLPGVFDSIGCGTRPRIL